MGRTPHQRMGKGEIRRTHFNRGSRTRSWRTQVRLENELRYRQRNEPTIEDELAELDDYDDEEY